MGFPIPDSGSVTEDTGVVGGQLTTNGDAFFFFADDTGQWTAETITGAYDSQLVIDEDGVWTYTADNSNASIQALDTGQTLTEVFTVTSTAGQTTITITINGQDEPPCFVAGTLIDTPHGPRPVETLEAGDLVLTQDGGAQPIRWHGTALIDPCRYDNPDLVLPVCLRRNALAPGVPDRDLWVSPMHRIAIVDSGVQLLFGQSEVLCPARHLVDGRMVRQDWVPEVRYHHLMLDSHHLLRTSGCSSESFYPGLLSLAGFADEGRESMFGAFPDLRATPEQYGPAVRRVLRGFEARLLSATRRESGRYFAADGPDGWARNAQTLRA